ncbi:hypothetical protein [Streptomyces sp. NPDC051636]|uniref:hypothetical protein n=1 Tax=Streptomyces sp. NPDC051636 TaxID=3365663 RepID=UPI003791A702
MIKDVTLHGVLSGVGHWDRLVKFVESGAVDLDALVGRVFPPVSLDAAFTRLAARDRRRPKVMVRVGTDRESAAAAKAPETARMSVR